MKKLETAKWQKEKFNDLDNGFSEMKRKASFRFAFRLTFRNFAPALRRYRI